MAGRPKRRQRASETAREPLRVPSVEAPVTDPLGLLSGSAAPIVIDDDGKVVGGEPSGAADVPRPGESDAQYLAR